jgi:hypothetical protein
MFRATVLHTKFLTPIFCTISLEALAATEFYEIKNHQHHPDDRYGVPETSGNLHILRRLSARENYVELLHNVFVNYCLKGWPSSGSFLYPAHDKESSLKMANS